MAYLWDPQLDVAEDELKERMVGRLIQGYMMKNSKYLWNFPLKKHSQENSARLEKTEQMLQEVRRIREKDNTYNKKARDYAQRMGS